MDNDDILDGLDDILGAAQPEPAPIAPKRARRTRAEMAAAAAQAATRIDEFAAVAVTVVQEARQAPALADLTPFVRAGAADPMAAQHGFSGRKLKIIIDKGHGKDDPTSVFLRLNNYEATAQRGVPIELYEEVVAACLDNAVQTVFAQPTEGVLIPHDALRFSYRVVR